MIATVTQGKSEAKVEVAAQGVSFADVICEALGYSSIELQSVIFTPGNSDSEVIAAGKGIFDIGYSIGKAGLFHVRVTFETER